jgi:hypothetical protein
LRPGPAAIELAVTEALARVMRIVLRPPRRMRHASAACRDTSCARPGKPPGRLHRVQVEANSLHQAARAGHGSRCQGKGRGRPPARTPVPPP